MGAIRTFHVNRGIAVTPPHPRNVYPWENMREGDSFFLPIREGENPASRRTCVHSSGKSWCNRHRPNFTVVTRRTPRGFRIWLVKRN